MSQTQRSSFEASGLTLALSSALLAVMTLAPGALPAQENAQPAQRAVRLALVEGKVQVSQNGQVLSEQAIKNTPLFEGAEVATAEDGRAELQFEDGSLVRITPNSTLDLVKLGQQSSVPVTELTLNKGLAYFELQPSASTQATVRFGSSVLTTTAFTVVRVNLDSQPGELAVFTGKVHVVREGVATDLTSGQSLRFSPNSASGYDLSQSIPSDSWDNWNADRDQLLQTEASQQTAATNSQPNANDAAWADLDSSGNWYNVPDQGYVWSPYDARASGWDPYGSGSWTWTPSYGYIWLSSYSWGYLPYHCGLWNYYDFGWGWSPGVCSPWWRSGIWSINIGRYPGWYRHPERPRFGPMPHPRDRDSRPPFARGILSPHPVVPVNRGTAGSPSDGPSRIRFAPVNQGGSQIQALRPTSSRPGYAQPGTGFSYRPSASSGSGFGQRSVTPGGGVRPQGPGSYAPGEVPRMQTTPRPDNGGGFPRVFNGGTRGQMDGNSSPSNSPRTQEPNGGQFNRSTPSYPTRQIGPSGSSLRGLDSGSGNPAPRTTAPSSGNQPAPRSDAPRFSSPPPRPSGDSSPAPRSFGGGGGGSFNNGGGGSFGGSSPRSFGSSGGGGSFSGGGSRGGSSGGGGGASRGGGGHRMD